MLPSWQVPVPPSFLKLGTAQPLAVRHGLGIYVTPSLRAISMMCHYFLWIEFSQDFSSRCSASGTWLKQGMFGKRLVWKSATENRMQCMAHPEAFFRATSTPKYQTALPSRGWDNLSGRGITWRKHAAGQGRESSKKVLAKWNMALGKMPIAWPCPRPTNSQSWWGPGILMFFISSPMWL